MPNPYEAKGPIRRASQSSGSGTASDEVTKPEPARPAGWVTIEAAGNERTGMYAFTDFPVGPVPAVLEWVGTNRMRAKAYLAYERTKPEAQQRRSLIRPLVAMVDGTSS